MGGAIGFTIRKADGELYVMRRWTNSMCDLIVSSKFIDCDEAHLNEYLQTWFEMVEDYNSVFTGKSQTYLYPMTTSYVGENKLAPDGYGLVVVDYMSKTVLHMQSYTNFVIYPSDLRITNNLKSDFRITDNLKDAEDIKALFDRRLVSIGDMSNRREWCKEKGEEFISAWSEFENKPISLKESLECIEQVGELMSPSMIVDYSPWTIKEYKESESRKMLSDIEALGFTITETDKQSWDLWEKDYQNLD